MDVYATSGREKKLSQKNSLDKGKVQVNQVKKLLFDLISSFLVMLVGYAVYKATGLYESVASVTGKVALGAVISLAYLVVFRRAYYTK